MGCISSKPSTVDNNGPTRREKPMHRQSEYRPPRVPLLTREGSSVSSDVNVSGRGLLVDRNGSDSIVLPVEHAPKCKVIPEGVFNGGPAVGIVPKSREGEQIAAGWPSWLVAAAGEALSGWVPRKADNFEKLDKIGQGTYSSVYKARDLINGKIVALKKVNFDNLDPDSVTFMAREILILRRLDHPNVIKLEGMIASNVSCNLYLVFEYMEHDLTGLVSLPGTRFSEPQIKCYMKQLLSGLEHCHSHGVMHRDIKGSNLLIDDSGVLKIADFGLATFYDPLHGVPMTSRVVTLWYRPPELLLGAEQYSEAVDLWSAGCILGELYCGKPLMPGRTEVEQLHKIFRFCGSPSNDFWIKSKLRHAALFRPQQPYRNRIAERLKDIPSPALALIETLLSVDPSCRGTAASALCSEFFTTEPLACDPSTLPKYPPSKEIDAKLREDRRKRHGGIQSYGVMVDPNEQESQYYEAAQADKANAELLASVQMLEKKRQSFLMNRSETFNCRLDAPSRHTYGPTRNAVLASNNRSEQPFGPVLSRRVAYSGPLTQGTMWSNAERGPIDLHPAQRGAIPSSSLSGSTTSRDWVTQGHTIRPGILLDTTTTNNNNNNNNYMGRSRKSRFCQLTGEVNSPGIDDPVFHSQNRIYSNQYLDSRGYLRGPTALDSFKSGDSPNVNMINFSGPLGIRSRNVEEILRERERLFGETARGANLDRSKVNKVTANHLLVPGG